ncbi:MAG: uridylate kinase [Clostridiales bacterium]|nr:uridylate kinase [Clostridiales bacterium]
MTFGIEIVGKIGSTALVDREGNDIDYNKFARISRSLRPGMLWVSSGATEIGRLDYLKRFGSELNGESDDVKTDYAAQGQAILMQTYRNFIDARYGVRQVLVEHQHFNDAQKRAHIKNLLLRAAAQSCIPIINYNDAVSCEENRKMEIRELLTATGRAVELVDNDETAAQIACLVNAKTLVILTELEGIYRDLSDPQSLITSIGGADADEVIANVDNVKKLCAGASRKGANGAAAKLEYIKPCVRAGTRVIIASAKYDLPDILSGKVPSTNICVGKATDKFSRL